MLLELTAGLLVTASIGFLLYYLFTLSQYRDRRQCVDRRQSRPGTWSGYDRRHQPDRRVSRI